jgi:dolichol kinase
VKMKILSLRSLVITKSGFWHVVCLYIWMFAVLAPAQLNGFQPYLVFECIHPRFVSGESERYSSKSRGHSYGPQNKIVMFLNSCNNFD